jgi:putative acetyltransferase
VALLIHHAIHEGAAGAYDDAQRVAWSPEPRSGPAMLERLSGQSVLLGADTHGLAGIFTLTQDGLLDLAFVRADRKGDGLAGRLHDALIARARAAGLKSLHTEASHIARRFFAKRGWSLERTQAVELRGASLENHVMVLKL